MNGRYGVILADPPWHFAVRSPRGEGRSASQHYSTMSLDQIRLMPVASWAAPDCCLFLWCIDPMLPQALDTMAEWGFTFKTVAFHWTKTNADGSPFCGMGFWTRANPELCLLGTRGSPSGSPRTYAGWWWPRGASTAANPMRCGRVSSDWLPVRISSCLPVTRAPDGTPGATRSANSTA
jgi:MT-A70